jgi:hypothetical protein
MLDVRQNLDLAEKIFLTPEEKIALLEAKVKRAEAQVRNLASSAKLLNRDKLK